MDTRQLNLLNKLLEHDVELREKIKEQVNELEKQTRAMVGILNKIHSTPLESIPPLLDEIRPIMSNIRGMNAAMAGIIPPKEFWRWKDLWILPLRSAAFSAVLTEFLTNGSLLSLEDTSNVLGIKIEWSDRYALSVEDYLLSLTNVINELSRYAVNSVTLGNFDEPIKISVFAKDIFTGFTMLNLRNDTLRRKFDALKYDIKKIEEVVYDVTLRKLASPMKIQEAHAI